MSGSVFPKRPDETGVLDPAFPAAAVVAAVGAATAGTYGTAVPGASEMRVTPSSAASVRTCRENVLSRSVLVTADPSVVSVASSFDWVAASLDSCASSISRRGDLGLRLLRRRVGGGSRRELRLDAEADACGEDGEDGQDGADRPDAGPVHDWSFQAPEEIAFGARCTVRSMVQSDVLVS